ncbi:hypothetical protein NEMIN01_1578 [Nematocida minor]|uniref:uncharacterized protein n=1 Tax=Nematocida minor TaxID=1912983 RepID=UPI00221ED883|nr:uncharacterized protein NEMIN01_1578 [Nematocida minor]KAI5191594.1 hypothetical protein NEMIN01_1578 [Nematocida minor]
MVLERTVESYAPEKTLISEVLALFGNVYFLILVTITGCLIVGLIFSLLHLRQTKDKMINDPDRIKSKYPLLCPDEKNRKRKIEKIERDFKKNYDQTMSSAKLACIIILILLIMSFVCLGAAFICLREKKGSFVVYRIADEAQTRVKKSVESTDFGSVPIGSYIKGTTNCILTEKSVICLFKSEPGKTITIPAYFPVLQQIEKTITDPEIIKKIRSHPNYLSLN